MSTVILASGGLDSTLMTVLAVEMGQPVYPLFINYGQLSAEKELSTCRNVYKKMRLPVPEVVDVSGYGKMFPCGLTSTSQNIYKDAFLPGRNLLFLLTGATYAYRVKAKAVAIGLLNESYSFFPDQTEEFVGRAESFISDVLDYKIRVVAPLISFTKTDVVVLAKMKGVKGTYSCHSGKEDPCGVCIACKEYSS